jgi:hypothetical protein
MHTLSLSSSRGSAKRDKAAAQSARGGKAAALQAVPVLMQLPMLSDILKASVCGNQIVR